MWGDTTGGVYPLDPDSGDQVLAGDYESDGNACQSHVGDIGHMSLVTARPPQVELVPNNIMYVTTVASLLGAVMGMLSVAIAIFTLATR